ncbi:cation-translocating P-type ATPase [Bacillus sp. HMF5848]|uniref:cation-translocating P-type ATPase n=1 Tax=Bacillus sp. HMF5848 TaxID=2495421 RepID=UPI000F77BA20|nr:cation-translocating P-type ATPase [Bacillus sp. HMF5848]RSK26176.1 cation-translocating P-type ATPase [Bacillus sp. HMF5848]
MANHYHNQTTDEVLTKINATKDGLTDTEVQKRQEQFGLNELGEERRKSTIQVFLEQFKDFLVIILIVAALLSAFLGKFESTVVILVVVIINAILGTVQHVKAEQSLKSLKNLSAPSAKVLRNGKKVEIPSKEVTVGDILYLDAGDFISADGRILESHSLQVNESSLTGESISVQKTIEPITEDDISIGDKTNMVFSGSFVTYGRGVIVVTEIGKDTEIGKIANLMENAKEKKTPLQVNLDNFGKKLAIAIIIIAIIIFAIDLFRGRTIIDSFMFAVALAVAAIPEALSSIVTIVLAFGTQKMAKENAIIRKLHAVESLGSISVICSDKTGTLTQNKMTVQQVFLDNQVYEHNKLQMNERLHKDFILMNILCNDAITTDKKEIGDPTEIALVNLGEEIYGLEEMETRSKYPRLKEVPFDSDRKLMSTVNTIESRNVLITKGAVDVLLDRIVKIETADGITDFSEEDRIKIHEINQQFSASGLRVLAFAYKEVNNLNNISTDDENNLIFVGLTAMMDPPRAESKDAVAQCITAGIKPVMITGDHKITASAIAKEIGILQDGQALEGFELEKMTDDDLKNRVENISVYARVSPEHKIRIVKAWQEKGNIVAMTGDGVNDGPALKQADIGIAMGITGTEVAKDASSMVLTDDNFSTIVKAIANGRSIYTNIKNAIRFLLAGNTAGIISVLYAAIGGLPVPFAPVHLLFINLLTDSLPAIAIGLEPHNKHVMNEKPRDVNTPLLNKVFASRLLIEGFLIAVATLLAFHIGLSTGDAMTASTMAFATLCLARLFHGFNARSKHSIFKVGLHTNLYLIAAVILGIILLQLVLLLEPLKRVFEVVSLTPIQFSYVYGLALMPLVLIQLYKIFFVK